MADHAELQERVFEGNRELVRAGLVVLTFGNVSGVDRSENVLAIKPSGVPYEELRPEAIVVVELETGEVVAGAAAVLRHAHARRPLPPLRGARRHRRTRTPGSRPPGRRQGASFPASARRTPTTSAGRCR